jgi:lipopolysaccharide export system permease protein
VITLVDRYIGRYVLGGTLLVLAVLTALFAVTVLVDALSDYGKGSFGTYELARYVVLSQPYRLYESFPVAALVGTLLGLSVLARGNELVALRASGVSAARLAGAAFKAGVLLVVAAVLLGETVVPVAETEAQEGRTRAVAKGLRTESAGVWLRDGSAFLNIGEVLPGQRLLRVSLYDFESEPCAAGEDCTDRRLRAYVRAASARLKDGHWRLRDVVTTSFDRGGVRSETLPELRWPTEVTPEVVDAFSTRPEGLSMRNLYRYVNHLESHRQDASRFRLAYWQKLLLPVAVAVMMLLAMPFVLRPTRSGGLGGRIFTGVMLGLGFIMLGRSFGYFGLLYGLPPLAGAVTPVLVFLVLAVVLLRRAG